MNWNLLKVFLAVAETGTLSGAARMLGINHSTAFRHLQALEEETGGKLFDRYDTGYELNALGDALFVSAKRIEDGFYDIERQVVGRDYLPRGNVRITAPNNIAYRYLPGYLENLEREYPDIKLELLVSNLEFNMNNRQADIAVRATDNPPEYLIGRDLGIVRWSVYCGARAKLDSLPGHYDELAGHLLVGACGGMKNLPAYRALEDDFGENIQVRSDDMVAMAHFAETSRMLAVLPDDQARSGLKKLFTLPAEYTSSLWLLTHPDLRNAQRIRVVMDSLQQAFAGEEFLR